MDKEEYFSKKLKRDFIRYALLQKPRFTAREISSKLKSSLDTDKIYHKIKCEITNTLNRHLSFDRLKNSAGELVTVIPDWLSPDIVKTIVTDYSVTISENFNKQKYLPALIQQIEKLTWAQGVDDMADNLKVFLSNFKSAAHLYSNMPRPEYNDYEIKEKFEAAKRITVREHIFRDNSEDIIALRSAILGYAQEMCEIEMYRQLAELYTDIAETPELVNMISAFEKAHLHGEAELEAMGHIPANEEWDQEYNRLVPVEFYERNVEDIDGAIAFHMVLFQAFSRNEDYLIREKYLTHDGELRIFTSPRFDGFSWSNINFYGLLK